MNCAESKKYLDAYIDGELEAGLMIEVDDHIERCEVCQALNGLKVRMKNEISRLDDSVRAPHDLRNRIVNLSSARRRQRWAIAIAAAPIAAAAALVMVFNFGSTKKDAKDLEPIARVVDDVASRHARELPMEVVGPDPSSAASWFRGKVDFPVAAPRLELKNASFQGARLSNVQAHQAAHMIYTVDGHKVTLMIFPTDKLSVHGGSSTKVQGRDVVMGRRNGYNVAVMIDGDMAYALSSDLPSERLVSMFKSLRI